MLRLDAHERQIPVRLARMVLPHLPDDFEQVVAPRRVHRALNDVDELRLIGFGTGRQPQRNPRVLGNLEGVSGLESSSAKPAHELRKGREIVAGRRPAPAICRIGGEGERQRRNCVDFPMQVDAGDGRDRSSHVKIGRLQHAPHSTGGA